MMSSPGMSGSLAGTCTVKTHHDLCLFLGGSDDSFTGDLLRLIAKADPGNRERLRLAYPRVVAAWQVWDKAASPLSADQLDKMIIWWMKKLEPEW
jgi:hypothetical protein